MILFPYYTFLRPYLLKSHINRRIFVLSFLFSALSLVPPAMAAKDFNIKNNSQSFLYVVGTSGNVGVSSVNPGQLMDVQGTVRALYFIGNGSQLTGLSAGGWTQVGNNIYNTNTGNVGINTTNGSNVGIGSASPGATLDVNGPIRSTSASGFSTFLGNVGIGSATPGKPLDVQGAVRMTAFVLSAAPANGDVD